MSHSPSDMDSATNSSLYTIASSSENDTEAPHQLNKLISELTCSDDANHGEPYLLILEEPQMNFRFRYVSEMGGTHGCLQGQNARNRNKTVPAVELKNFQGRAKVKCRLVQYDNDEEHPHRLQLDDEPGKPQEIFGEVGSQGYKLLFPDMGIIYTAKKNVAKEIYRQHYMNAVEPTKLMTWSQEKAKHINLNIVRLQFSAHHWDTDAPICKPVYSTPIHNLKSAETNELKICRMDRATGSVRGNDEVFILVEKVNKKNIKVRFVEIDEETGSTMWSSEAHFTQNDVHHQFAIVFKTPAYKDLLTPRDVNVSVQLYRPQDGRSSERMPFTYKADPRYSHCKKRKANPSHSSLSSLEDNAGGSLKSVDLPLTVISNLSNALKRSSEPMVTDISVPQPAGSTSPSPAVHHYMQIPPSGGKVELGEALYLRDHRGEPTLAPPLHGSPAAPGATYTGHATIVPSEYPLGEFNMSDTIDKALKEFVQNSGEYQQALANLDSGPFHEYRMYMESRVHDVDSTYVSGITSHFNQLNHSAMRTDVARKKSAQPVEIKSEDPSPFIKNEPYSAKYQKNDGAQVNNLVSEFCELMKRKEAPRKQQDEKMTALLQKIMEFRLSNGDTFLHMLVAKQTHTMPMLEYLVKQISRLGLLHLLNEQNYKGETIVHLAMKYDLHNRISLLVENGCNPMLEDTEGNNALHLSVLYSDKERPCQCLAELLRVMRAHWLPHYDIDAHNNAKETPLLIAAKYGDSYSLQQLLTAGAKVKPKDKSGKHPLHTAVSGDHLAVVNILLDHMEPGHVDIKDNNGNTALQIVCSGSLRDHTMDIVKLLLQRGANCMKESGGNSSPLALAANKKELLALLQKYVGDDFVDVKSEPEDECDTSEEDSSDDEELDQSAPYMSEVADILDKSGKWRELALKLDCHSVMNWYENTPSPTKTLFKQIHDCEKQLNPRVFAQILRDIGEEEASDLVLLHV